MADEERIFGVRVWDRPYSTVAFQYPLSTTPLHKSHMHACSWLSLYCLFGFRFLHKGNALLLGFTMPKRGAPSAATKSDAPEWVKGADDRLNKWRSELLDMYRPKNEIWGHVHDDAGWADASATPSAGNYDEFNRLVKENRLARWALSSRFAQFNAQSTTRVVLGRPVQVPLMSDVLVLNS